MAKPQERNFLADCFLLHDFPPLLPRFVGELEAIPRARIVFRIVRGSSGGSNRER